MESLNFHEVAGIFPLMGDFDYQALVEDIRQHGQREPITLHPDGSIVDGRNRYLACFELNIEPRCVTWDGNGELLDFVISLNLHRRHLNETQRAVIASKLSTLHPGDNQVTQICGTSQKQAAQLLNVSTRLIQTVKAIEREAPEHLPEMERGELAADAVMKQVTAIKNREQRIENLAIIAQGNKPLGSVPEKFPVVYADPPWLYDFQESHSREIENHYPTMPIEDICAMPLTDITTPDAVLFLWATSPKLPQAIQVIESWGFTYKTSFVWVKDKIATGYWCRGQHELLLVATKGAPPTPAPADRHSSVINAPRGEHSVKPVEVYEIIEAMFPTLPKIELFCRGNNRPLWTAWGNQA